MKKIEIVVKDGDAEYSCVLRRPDIQSLSKVNKLAKVDEVVAAQELLKACWVSGDEEILRDAYLLMAAAGQTARLNAGIIAEIKN